MRGKDGRDLGIRVGGQSVPLRLERSSGQSVADIQAGLETVGRQLGCEYCKTWLTARPIADRCRYLADENQNVPQVGDQSSRHHVNFSRALGTRYSYRVSRHPDRRSAANFPNS